MFDQVKPLIDQELLKLAFNYGVPAVIALFLIGFMTLRLNGKLEKNTVATQANTVQSALTLKSVEDNSKGVENNTVQVVKLTERIDGLREEIRISRETSRASQAQTK